MTLPLNPDLQPRRAYSLVVFLLVLVSNSQRCVFALPDGDWPVVGGDKGGMRYSPLDQVNRQNVKELRVAWTYHTGGASNERKSTIECTPIVVEGKMYVTSPDWQVVALDPSTGHELWRFDPQRASRYSYLANRGVAYWSDGRIGGARRVLVALPDGRLVSLDAHSGKPDPAFGKQGVVNLREGLDRDLTGLTYGATSAPAIFEHLVILGFSVGEGPGPAAPGDMRAFDVRTGAEVWRFHTVPHPGEFGHDSWKGDSWRNRGGANGWGGVTIDVRRGLAFVGTGSATFDFYGGDRHGHNLFANSVLALEARTGRRVWHYQIVRHDLWDYDLPTYPNLVTVRHQRGLREAVAQVTKTGYVFLFDRVTGKPLFEVKERASPWSDVPGEAASPTQIFPLKPPPFSRQEFTEAGITNVSQAAHDYVLERLKSLRYGKMFNPPSFQGTVVFPGFHGGANWSGASFDPTTGMLYVNANNVPWLLTLVAAEPGKGYPYTHTGYLRFTDNDGYPAIKPPWGTLTAVDLNRGEINWQVTLGEFPELTARGIPLTGTENFGGTIVTAGGLVFIGATMDEKFRAFDKASGRQVWEYKLEAGGYATPCTYSVKGRQFVVIAAGGGGKLGTKSGDSYVAFALPTLSKNAD